MSNIFVITFDNEEEAGRVRESLRSLQKQGMLALDDAAVVVKNAEGKVDVKNEMDRGVKVGAVGGSLLGLLIASVFFPVAGLVIGALGGAGVGALAGLGVDRKFVNEVKESLQPGTSALFVIVRSSNRDAAMAALRPYQGTVYHSSLDPEDEKLLRDVLSKRIE